MYDDETRKMMQVLLHFLNYVGGSLARESLPPETFILAYDHVTLAIDLKN